MPPSAPPRRFAPQPVETSSAEDRRFAVQPVETTTASSRERKLEQEDKPKPRRFAVEPVETETRSSKSSKSGDLNQAGHIRFLPEPVETVRRTNRKSRAGEDDELDMLPEPAAQPSPRKFAPIPIDTAQRSHRAEAGEKAGPSMSHNTESSHHLHTQEHQRHIRGGETPVNDDAGSDDEAVTDDYASSIPPEMRRHLAPLDGSAPVRRPSIQPQRSHSFRCPDLDTIESSESECGSNASTLSRSPSQDSPITAPDSSYAGGQKHAARSRESVDENYSRYLLELEAKKAEERLRELAEGAFPNPDFHEPVQHYMDRDDESDEMELEDRVVTYEIEEDMLMEMAARRESTANISWEQMEMQRHHEQMEQERNAAKLTEKKKTQQVSQSPWWNPTAAAPGPENADSEMQSMRDRARPPMLGADLVFPRCPSPDPARFDVTQGSAMLRSQMRHLSKHADSKKSDAAEPGLWHNPNADLTPRNITITTTTAPNSPKTPKKGLWGGFCVDDGEAHISPSGLTAPYAPTGLMTPKVDFSSSNPFEQSFAAPSHASVGVGAGGVLTPPTPPRSIKSGDLSGIDTVLSAEQALDDVMAREFPAAFITQVYNYLSLGYPALARPFDEELSKISRIPIAELRADDRKAAAAPRGYIRLGEDFEGGGGQGEVEEGMCMRWRALRLYVREWTRQEKDMVHELGPGGEFGTTARRGSWAF
ncbi:hypothetical protein LTR53_001483 [Teratosphaeriaceae sp. CCFEE 6253]|nr:hypothetical protein LTR53_001483 [Teratosphaeriaceae sp. CCFEE 6253]